MPADAYKRADRRSAGDKYWRLLTGENVVSRAIQNGYPGINASITYSDQRTLWRTAASNVADSSGECRDAEKLGLEYYTDEVQDC